MNNLPANSGHSRGRGRGKKPNEELSRGLVPQLGHAPVPQQAEARRPICNPATLGDTGAAEVGDPRGSVRGRRLITEIVRSRPSGLLTKMGTTGKPITVQTNYFKFLKCPNWSLYQYRVDFSPDVDNTFLRQGLLREHSNILGGYIFDGSVLFCTTKFKDTPNSPYVLDLLTKSRSGENISIKIRSVGIVEAMDPQQLQVLNLILRRAMEGLQLQIVSRNYFDPQAKIVLDSKHRMELWPGYITSIRQHESDFLLCTEIAHKVMRTDTLYQILSKNIREHDDFQGAFKREVIGMIVLTEYNNKTYRVDDVAFESSPMSKFSTKDGEISYVEYYKKRYNIIIRDHKQPLVVSRPSEKNIRGGADQLIMLIPELARATGLTDGMRSDFQLMKAMGEHTRIAPDRRIDRLRAFNQRLQKSESSVNMLKSWNVELDSALVEIRARVLPPQKIVFGGQRRFLCDARADWTYECRKDAMFTNVDIKRWYVITPSRSKHEVQQFVKLCMQASGGMKLRMSEPRYEEISDDRNGTYSQAIDNAAAKDPQIIMIVIKSPNEEKYSCIKKRTCVDRPVPSQVVTLKTIAPRPDRSSGLMSIATKVVIQMNAKLMGAPWMIELPINGLMTVGFDVCHSSKNKNKSYGAFVATMDMKSSTRYFSSVTEHMKGQELSNQILMNMTCALKAYREHHGSLPDRILFFRDGVGDGQLNQVFNIEVKFLKTRLDEIYKSAGKEKGCNLAFIVVTKRINTRYFVNKRNPEPGTIVDDVITLPERYDFYLVSQAIKQGTVSPTNYNVLHDSMGLNADKIQILTYKMTHMYYNWSGTCRVPAVCQYAHKLAFLIAESIHRAPSSSLENQLFFL
ncbi:protein aubergine-like isoform X1 [Drosophila sulfurigaster albostrigata]|uniref:protein aubergine-like isoform X1 n=1 Tax=Drosophila sulfurigaster albostrigata TaxID=89887 RepID=UPI002D21DC16|nr:protein aubergine-like isoform X1 [Drosophila sulfurigaster albostrigata]